MGFNFLFLNESLKLITELFADKIDKIKKIDPLLLENKNIKLLCLGSDFMNMNISFHWKDFALRIILLFLRKSIYKLHIVKNFFE